MSDIEENNASAGQMINIYDHVAISTGSVNLKVLNKTIIHLFNLFIYKMITKQENPISFVTFIKNINDHEYYVKNISGFIVEMKGQISDDLLDFFYRIYKKRDDDEVFEDYVLNLVNFRLRNINAEYVRLSVNYDYTKDPLVNINTEMLLNLEVAIEK